MEGLKSVGGWINESGEHWRMFLGCIFATLISIQQYGFGSVVEFGTEGYQALTTMKHIRLVVTVLSRISTLVKFLDAFRESVSSKIRILIF